MATAAIPATDSERFKLGRLWGARLLRLVQAGLLVGIACMFGRYLGLRYGRLIVPDGNEELLKYSLFSAAGLSTIKEFLNIFPKFVDYVKEGKGEKLYDFSSFVLLTSLTLAIASLGISKVKDPPVAKDPIPPVINQSGTSPVAFLLLPSGKNTKFLVPFSKNARGCKEDAPEFKEGLTWFDGTDKFIDQLTTGLESCSVSGKKVKVEVKGFASSADFKSSNGAECTNSNDLNVSIANLRALAVRKEMMTALGGSTAVEVTPKHWSNAEFKTMREEALFNDRDANNKPVEGRGDLTRRADIVVTDAAGCEPR